MIEFSQRLQPTRRTAATPHFNTLLKSRGLLADTTYLDFAQVQALLPAVELLLHSVTANEDQIITEVRNKERKVIDLLLYGHLLARLQRLRQHDGAVCAIA